MDRTREVTQGGNCSTLREYCKIDAIRIYQICKTYFDSLTCANAKQDVVGTLEEQIKKSQSRLTPAESSGHKMKSVREKTG